ncbi:MAG: phosphate ABC transporter permease PstA [Helicobacteraceae bacterium]|jgi:phosphate transport system permease protein|nr:phosphate ABC transporter permease PstA [Helicobacteraceae bacterium]
MTETFAAAARQTGGRLRLQERVMAICVWTGAIVTFCVLLYIVAYIMFKGIPYISPSLFAPTYNSENVSLTPALVSTAIITFFSLFIAVPFGVFSAVYLTEYAKRGNRAVSVVRITTETLAGIPSIVYGLFGMLFFVTFLGWGFSVLSGAFTLSIMILPLIMRSSEEALKAVPDTLREGAFGLGAGKLRVVFRVVLPSAMPGIAAGIMLAIGRIVGESAALIYTAGTVAQIPVSPMESARTMSVHMFALSSEGLHIGEGYATAVVLLILVVLINITAAKIAKKIGGNR